MTKAFLDTNILLEVVFSRKYKKSCQRILQAGIEGHINNCASFLTFANMAYIMQKEKLSKQQIYDVERDFESILEVMPMDRTQLREALTRQVKDFEDMLQYQCAISGECDCIVTINTKHFQKYTNIPIYKPDEMLDKIIKNDIGNTNNK